MTTYRVKHSRSNPYARLNKKFLESYNLSAKAKGILAYLLSRPDDWRICINQLTKVFTDGESAIRSGLAELKEAGYLTKAAVRDRCGRIISWVTDVYEVPQTLRRQTDKNGNYTLHNLELGAVDAQPEDNSRDGDFPQLENPQVVHPQLENPQLDKPLVEKPNISQLDEPDVEELDVDEPDVENRGLIINDDQLKNELTNPPLPPQGERENSNFEFCNSEPNPMAGVEPLDSTDSLVNYQNLVEDKYCAVPQVEIIKKYDKALGIKPPEDWKPHSEKQFSWIPDGPWRVEGKLDPNFVTWQALDWQKAYGGDLYKKRADVLRHFKKDPANLAIAWEHYSNEQRFRYENAAVRMHNGLEIQPDEQQRLVQHSRAVTERLPEEISLVATTIQDEVAISTAPARRIQEVLHSTTDELIEVFESPSVSSSVEDEEIGQLKAERAFNQLVPPESKHPDCPSHYSKTSNSVPTDSTGMAQNPNAYREWKPKALEGEPVTPEQFRVLLGELSQRLSMPVQQPKPKVSDNSEIEELNHWLSDPLLRKEVMPRVMKGDRYTLEFDEDGEPIRVVEAKS